MAIVPQDQGLFSQQVPGIKNTEWQPTPALAANIEAIINPSEVLLRKQTENVLNMASQFKTDELDYDIARKAQGEIEEFKQKVMDMYKGNKGMSRLTLTPQQKLEVNKMQGELLTSIGWGKQATKHLTEASNAMKQALLSGDVTPEDYQAWLNEWGNNVKSAKTTRDVPNAYLDAMKYLQDKPSANKSVFKSPVEWVNFVNQGQKGTFDKDYNLGEAKAEIQTQMQGANWANTEAMLTSYGVLNPSMSTEQKVEAAAQYARNHFMPRVVPTGGNTYINNYNNNPKLVNFTQNPSTGEVTWSAPDMPVNYSKMPNKGFIIAATKKPDGTWVGTYSVPKEASLTQDQLNTILALGATSKGVDQFGNDTYEVKLDASDYGAIMRRGWELENANEYGWSELSKQRGKTDKAETPDTSKAGGPYLKFYKFKSSDPIDVKRLVKDEIYFLDGEKVKWDGTNFDYIK